MNEFLFRMPTRVIFGAGSLRKVPQLCKEQGFDRIFIVTGSSSTSQSPHLHELIADLNALGISTQVFSEVEADPSVETVTKGAAELTAFGADAAIASTPITTVSLARGGRPCVLQSTPLMHS